MLFRPSLGNFAMEGLQRHLFESIMHCDVDVRRELFSNIILCGGTSMIEGMGEKLWQEMKQLVSSS